jgi:predicted cobalt transporter CbtA
MSSPKPAQQGGETSCCAEASLLAGVALLSAFVTSCFTIVIQLTQAIGVIVDSEAYEQPDAPGNSTGHAGMAVAEEVWAPADGAERNVCTWLADMLILFAFSLMLVGLYHALNRPVGGLDGIMDMKATLCACPPSLRISHTFGTAHGPGLTRAGCRQC